MRIQIEAYNQPVMYIVNIYQVHISRCFRGFFRPSNRAHPVNHQLTCIIKHSWEINIIHRAERKKEWYSHRKIPLGPYAVVFVNFRPTIIRFSEM